MRSLYRSEAFESVVGEIEEYEMEIVALQETKWAGKGSLSADSYMLQYKGSEIHNLDIRFHD